MDTKEMALGLQPVPEVREVPEWMLEGVTTIRQAARVCMRESIVKRTDQTWATLLGKKAGEFSLIMSDNQPTKKTRHFPAEWVEEMEMLAGNMAITQWLALRKKRRLSQIDERTQRIESLQRQLDELRRSA